MRRFKARGRVTNYEMGWLRENGVWRDSRWNYLWASMSDKFHPVSQLDWVEHKKGDDTMTAL